MSDDFGLRAEVDEMQERLEEMQHRLQVMEKTLSSIRSLGQEFWRTEAVAFLLGTGVHSWHYDAREENALFLDLSDCEIGDRGVARRWVGSTGSLGATISINRSQTLAFEARLSDFSSVGLREALTLDVDGMSVPWTERSARSARAFIPAAPGQASLRFRLHVNNSALLQGGGRSFAITEIDISPAAGASLPHRVNLSATQIGDGGDMFHALEYDPQNRPYRWTGPNTRSSFAVLVDRSQPLILTLCMTAFVDRAKQSPFVLEVDGESFHPEIFEEAEGIMARLSLPPKPEAGPTTVTLVLPTVLQPNESDRRLLGIAFRYLKFEPTSIHRGDKPEGPHETKKSFAATLVGLARGPLSASSHARLPTAP